MTVTPYSNMSFLKSSEILQLVYPLTPVAIQFLSHFRLVLTMELNGGLIYSVTNIFSTDIHVI